MMLVKINFSWALDINIGIIVHSPYKPIFYSIVSGQRLTRPSDKKCSPSENFADDGVKIGMQRRTERSGEHFIRKLWVR